MCFYHYHRTEAFTAWTKYGFYLLEAMLYGKVCVLVMVWLRFEAYLSQAKCNVGCKTAAGDTPLVLAQKGLTHAILKDGDKVSVLQQPS